MNFSVFLRLVPLFLSVFPLFAMDSVTFLDRGKEREDEGRIVLEASDGTAFEGRDGQYFIIRPESLRSKRSDDKEFAPYLWKEIKIRLKNEFPESGGWEIHETDNFFVVYLTSKAFAQWYGQLLEKLYKGYTSFWKGEGLTLKKPDFPLVAVVLTNSDQFIRFAKIEGFTMIPGQCAYYNKATNRIVMCDLTGSETQRQNDKSRASSRDIQTFLSQPNAAYNVASVIHEAVHLVGFNTGVHPRFAPVPLWLCEGLAVFHEVPDRGKKAGWSIAPKVNDNRLLWLRRYLRTQPAEPLQTVIRADKPFNEADSAGNSYAVAWGLTYYLAKQRPKDLAAYLKKMQTKTVLSKDSPEIRIEEFEKCFGSDWDKLTKECWNYLGKL
ncbi:MAG: DUF1570 domain-containing protein [Planctomycetaceae bacterium]|jgi:hypothetical protein|nr:DUF1570 domain-containing protein [Planctomycetaceae bacterium]